MLQSIGRRITGSFIKKGSVMQDFEMDLTDVEELDSLESAWYFVFGSSWVIVCA